MIFMSVIGLFVFVFFLTRLVFSFSDWSSMQTLRHGWSPCFHSSAATRFHWRVCQYWQRLFTSSPRGYRQSNKFFQFVVTGSPACFAQASATVFAVGFEHCSASFKNFPISFALNYLCVSITVASIFPSPLPPPKKKKSEKYWPGWKL